MKRACNIEVRNLAIMWYGGGGDGDSLSFDTENKNIWVHNVEFFYGHGKDADQAKGDGSIDLKAKSDYVTVSYCHFWDSGKALVLGGPWEVSNYDKAEAKVFATYHHNLFDHSDSRHPRCVSGSAHVYNNYYDGVAKYGPGAAVNASVFVENNYFRNCPRPMLIATQGSDNWDSATGTYKDKGTLSGQAGGMIKEYGNVIVGAKRFITQNDTSDGQIDAYHVESRDEKVPETVKALKSLDKEGTSFAVYNNFDTNSDIMYDYNVQTAEEAKETVVKEAGRRNGGDFKYTFDNAVQDTNSDVIPELQSAVINYESKLISVQGMTGDPNEGGDNSGDDPGDNSGDNPGDNSGDDPGDNSGDDPGDNSGDDPGDNSGDNTTPTSDWNADQATPNWLDITGCTQGNTSSSHKVFQDVDSSIASQKKRYSVPQNSVITIKLDSASVVKVYIAGDDNSDGKGNVTAELDGENIGTYSLPSRKSNAAKPFEITTTKGGTLKLTNSFKGLLYKITISSESGGSTEPVVKEKYDVTLKIKNNTAEAASLTVGENTIEVSANGEKEEVVKLEAGKYSVAVSGSKLKASPSSITVEGEQTIEITVEEISESVIVTDKDGGYIGGYEKISDALAADSTVNGSVISVKPGYYQETFEVSKSVTLKKADDLEGEVVIYSPGGPYGGSMDGIVLVSTSGVTFKDLTLLNNTQSSYKNIQAASTAGNTAAALVANGDNGLYENCTFISVQDTLVTKGYSTSIKIPLKQTYNNCVFYGATDFICGACDIAFNNCEFRFFTGALKEKIDAYIFAPDTDAKWVVNGGSIVKDETCIAKNLFYARAWESHSSTSQTLDIFGVQNDLQMATSKGLMGFGSSTGGGKPHHNINEYKFNVYEGSDKNSPLIATTDILGVDIFEINKNKAVIEFKNNSSANLIVGEFGKDLSGKFVQNVLTDVVEIGFVSKANASEDLISDTNTIKITQVYKNLKSEGDLAYSLMESLNAQDGFLGAAVLTGIGNGKTVELVPYVKYDPTTDSDRKGVDKDGNEILIDKKCIYKFGEPVAVTLKGTGGEGKITTPAGEFKANEADGVFGAALPAGIGENNCSNVIAADDEVISFAGEPLTISSSGNVEAPHVGDTLTAKYSLDSANNSKDASVIIWYRVKADNTEEKIKEATASDKTYEIKEADLGCKIKVEVTPANTDGLKNESAKTSAVLNNVVTVKNPEEPDEVSAPVATPAPENGPVKAGVNVRLSCGTDGAVIYYNVNADSNPAKDAQGTEIYTAEIDAAGGIELKETDIKDGHIVIKAMAAKNEFKDSEVKTFDYTVDVDVPVEKIETPTAVYKNEKVTGAALEVDKDSADKLILSTTTSGAVIKYQFGEENAQTAANGEVVIPTGEAKTLTFKAWAEKDGSISEILTFTIIVKDSSGNGGETTDKGKGISVVFLDNAGEDDRGVVYYYYTGAKIIPDIEVVDLDRSVSADNKKVLAPGVDYTVKYKNNNKEGSAMITIVGKGNYIGKDVTETFKIKKAEQGEDEKADLKGVKIDTIAPQEYNGTAQYPDFTLISKDKKRTNYKYNETSKKYECTTTDGTAEAIKAAVTLSNNTNKGTATIFITGGAGKNGKPTTLKKTFKITPVDLSSKGKVVLSDTPVSYSAKGAVPDSIVVTAKLSKNGETIEKTLLNGRDYTIKYSANKVAGKGKVTITGKGNYTKKLDPKDFAIESLNMADTRVVAVTACADLKAGKVKAIVVDENDDMLKASQYTVEVLKNATDTQAMDKNTPLKAGDIIYVRAKAKDTKNLKEETKTEAVPFTVGKNIAKAKFTLTATGKSKTYTGAKVELDVTKDLTVTIKEKKATITLKPKDSDNNGDYEIISYSNNIDKGTATVVIKGINDYSGTKTIKFKIVGKKMIKSTR